MEDGSVAIDVWGDLVWVFRLLSNNLRSFQSSALSPGGLILTSSGSKRVWIQPAMSTPPALGITAFSVARTPRMGVTDRIRCLFSRFVSGSLKPGKPEIGFPGPEGQALNR